MAGEAQDQNWPLPKFYFLVEWGDGTKCSFQEVCGLDAGIEPIEYRQGNNPEFSVIKMPGSNTFNNVTMKKGLFADDTSFWDWHEKIKMNVIERMDVKIKLLDETGSPTMTWTLSNAWPAKISSSDLKSVNNEIAVEELELAYEGITIENA